MTTEQIKQKLIDELGFSMPFAINVANRANGATPGHIVAALYKASGDVVPVRQVDQICKTFTPELALNLSMLKLLPHGTIFATGIGVDEPDGINMANTSKALRWVAVRRQGPNDWCIYCSLIVSPKHDHEYVRRHGDKVHDDRTIRRLIPCTDEAFARYGR